MGSTLFLLDQDHEIRKTYRYDAFGNILKETGDIPNRLTYTGRIYDCAAVQYYLRARFYNPAAVYAGGYLPRRWSEPVCVLRE